MFIKSTRAIIKIPPWAYIREGLIIGGIFVLHFGGGLFSGGLTIGGLRYCLQFLLFLTAIFCLMVARGAAGYFELRQSADHAGYFQL